MSFETDSSDFFILLSNYLFFIGLHEYLGISSPHKPTLQAKARKPFLIQMFIGTLPLLSNNKTKNLRILTTY